MPIFRNSARTNMLSTKSFPRRKGGAFSFAKIVTQHFFRLTNNVAGKEQTVQAIQLRFKVWGSELRVVFYISVNA